MAFVLGNSQGGGGIVQKTYFKPKYLSPVVDKPPKLKLDGVVVVTVPKVPPKRDDVVFAVGLKPPNPG